MVFTCPAPVNDFTNMRVDRIIAAVPPDQRISIVEEQLNVEKKVVDRASIRLNKKVEEKTVEVPLTTRTHGYSVERTSLSEYVGEAPTAIRYEGDAIVISVIEEELVTVTRLKVVEEIRLIPL